MRRFRANEPDVAFEAFDEEIVAVNLNTGNYYSLSGSGPQIWIDAIGGRSLDEMVGLWDIAGPAELADVRAQIAAFLDRLVAEKLLVDAAGSLAVAAAEAAPRPPFAAPVIENYSDMQDLLMLDPIHDVDGTGWPVAKNPP